MVNEFEAAARFGFVVLASVLTAPLAAGGETAPPPVAAACAVLAVALAAESAVASAVWLAGFEQPQSKPRLTAAAAATVKVVRIIVSRLLMDGLSVGSFRRFQMLKPVKS
jgi:hypothetical protein